MGRNHKIWLGKQGALARLRRQSCRKRRPTTCDPKPSVWPCLNRSDRRVLVAWQLPVSTPARHCCQSSAESSVGRASARSPSATRSITRANSSFAPAEQAWAAVANSAPLLIGDFFVALGARRKSSARKSDVRMRSESSTRCVFPARFANHGCRRVVSSRVCGAVCAVDCKVRARRGTARPSARRRLRPDGVCL